MKIAQAIKTIDKKANPEIIEYIENNSHILKEYGINTQQRLKMFLAQVGHESAGFKALVEIRSDASAERKYGYQTRVGKILGNIKKGDGARYKGRGIIQITGRYNYKTYGDLIGEDLESNPNKAAELGIALRVACAYWESKGLNELADQNNYKAITRRINGGYNGYADRVYRLNKLKDLDIKF